MKFIIRHWERQSPVSLNYQNGAKPSLLSRHHSGKLHFNIILPLWNPGSQKSAILASIKAHATPVGCRLLNFHLHVALSLVQLVFMYLQQLTSLQNLSTLPSEHPDTWKPTILHVFLFSFPKHFLYCPHLMTPDSPQSSSEVLSGRRGKACL